ncbi:hypothetical protein B0H14DRAFT_2398565, partial [Mycena olivaceomarginata]
AASLDALTGATLRLECYKTLGRHFTFEAVISEDHQLVKDGPHKYIRHLSYTGAVLAYIGLMIYYDVKYLGQLKLFDSICTISNHLNCAQEQEWLPCFCLRSCLRGPINQFSDLENI